MSKISPEEPKFSKLCMKNDIQGQPNWENKSPDSLKKNW